MKFAATFPRLPRLGALALLIGIALTPAPSGAAIVERVVAIVGEHAILLSDLKERALPYLVRVYQQVPEGPQRTAALNQIYGGVLDRMIEEELEDAAAARMGITVSSQEIDDSLARVAAQNNMSKGALLAEAKRSGLSVAAYREELRRQVLQAKITNVRLQGRIRVTEADVRTAYRDIQNEERLRNPTRSLRLVLPLGKSAEDQAKQVARADAIVKRVRDGEEFRDLIEVTSGLPGSGLSSPKAPQEEPESLRRALIALEVGEIAAPVRLEDRIVIVQVIERGPSELPPFEEVVDQLQQRVYMEKMAKARAQWLEGLKRRTHVERKL